MMYICLCSSQLLCFVLLYSLPLNLSGMAENYFFQVMRFKHLLLPNILEASEIKGFD